MCSSDLKTVGTIAKELSLSVKTVSEYRSRLLAKMNLKNSAELHSFLKTKHSALLAKIEETKQLDKDAEAALSAAIADFKKSGAF